jgi:hypothetical protein
MDILVCIEDFNGTMEDIANFRGEHKMIVTGQLVTGDRSSREGGSVVPSWGRLCGS